MKKQKLKELLCERFENVNFENAKSDILPFINDSSKIALWSKDFFCSVTMSNLK